MKRGMKKNDGGFAFLTVVFIMVAFTILGVGAVALITGSASQMEDEFHSQQAFDLANAGIAYEAEQLENDSDWSDNTGYTKVMDPGQFTISYIAQSTNQCTVKSVGTVQGVSRAVQQVFSRGQGPMAFTKAIYTENDIDVSGSSSGEVTGDVSAGGTIDEDGGVTFNDEVDANNPDADVPTVDWAYWQAIADHVITGNFNFSSTTYTGIYYITGNVTFNNDAILNGTIVSTGQVTINGAANVAITATSPYPAIVTKGTLTLNGNANLQINGFVLTLDYVTITGNQDIHLTGGLVSEGNVTITGNSVVDIVYDENYVPGTDGFIGGEGGGGGETLDGWSETM